MVGGPWIPDTVAIERREPPSTVSLVDLLDLVEKQTRFLKPPLSSQLQPYGLHLISMVGIYTVLSHSFMVHGRYLWLGFIQCMVRALWFTIDIYGWDLYSADSQLYVLPLISMVGIYTVIEKTNAH